MLRPDQVSASDYSKYMSISTQYSSFIQFISLVKFVSQEDLSVHMKNVCKDSPVMNYFSERVEHISYNESVYWYFSGGLRHVTQMQDFNPYGVSSFSRSNCPSGNSHCVSEFFSCLTDYIKAL